MNKTSNGKPVLFGVIGIAVLFCIWGIVKIYPGSPSSFANKIASNSAGNENISTDTDGEYIDLGFTNDTGTISAEIEAANASIHQALNSYNATCTGQGSSSSACQTAGTGYEQSFHSYKTVLGGNGIGIFGNSCTKITDCSGALACSNGLCVKLSGANGCMIGSTSINNGGCTNGNILGSSCSGDGGCSGNLVCDQQSVCSEPLGSYTCGTDQFEDSYGQCVDKSALGKSCTQLSSAEQGVCANGYDAITCSCIHIGSENSSSGATGSDSGNSGGAGSGDNNSTSGNSNNNGNTTGTSNNSGTTGNDNDSDNGGPTNTGGFINWGGGNCACPDESPCPNGTPDSCTFPDTSGSY